MGGAHVDRPDGLLLERDDQLAAIADAADSAASGEGRVIAVVGEAGIGKSSLIEVADDRATGAGLRVLRARGAELDRDLSFAVALQLFGGAAAELDRDGLFAGSAALARPLLLGERPPANLADGDAAPIIHGLSWLVSELAERRPLALLVDDLHWMDELSLRFVLRLCDRARDLPLLLVVAARPAEPGAPSELIERVVGHDDAAELTPRPLSEEAVGRIVVRADFAGSDQPGAFVAACHEVTGGNPLMLNELLHALAEEGMAADAAGVERVRVIGPRAISRAVAVTLGRLPPAAGAVARALAVLGDGAPLYTVAELAGLGVEEAAAAAAALEAGGIFRRQGGLGFVHPIVRSAVYAGLPPSERGLEHRRAARVLGPDAPIERVAAHLLHAVPADDPWVVTALTQAAERALGLGAPAAAISHLERALAEPPPSAARAQVLALLGEAQAAAGEPGAAATLSQAAEASAGAERARMLLALGRVHLAAGALRDAAAAFDRGTEALAGEDEELGLELDAAWVMATLFDPAVGGIEALRRVEPLLAPGVEPQTPGQRKLLAHIASAETLKVGDRELGVELVRRAWGDGVLLEDTSADDPVLGSVTAALSFAERHGEALEVADAMVEHAGRQGSALGFVSASYLRGALFLQWGRLPEAIADLEVAVDGRRSGWEQYRPRAVGQLAEALYEAGDEERALDLLRAAEDEPGYGHGVIWGSHLDHRGMVALARGANAEAAECFERAYEGLTGLMPSVNPVFSPSRRGRAVALSRLGRADEARTLAEEDLEIARAWGAPGTIAMALAARGIVAGRDGERDLREAAAAIEALDAGLATARILLELGTVLRATRQREEAQDVLRRALDAADRCGAVRLARLAREELVALGARPRRARLSGVASLTPGELRVARMAAEEMTNREIAEALFVTGKAVQWHLGNVYRKLGIRSREELPTALASEEASVV